MNQKLKIFTDGGSRGNPGKAGVGIHVVGLDNKIVYQQSTFLGRKTNNEAEYLGFLLSLKWLETYLKTTKVDSIEWFLDSKLVVEQISHRWKIKEGRLLQLAGQCWQQLQTLTCSHTINHISREKNAQADQLANQAMDQS